MFLSYPQYLLLLKLIRIISYRKIIFENKFQKKKHSFNNALLEKCFGDNQYPHTVNKFLWHILNKNIYHEVAFNFEWLFLFPNIHIHIIDILIIKIILRVFIWYSFEIHFIWDSFDINISLKTWEPNIFSRKDTELNCREPSLPCWRE